MNRKPNVYLTGKQRRLIRFYLGYARSETAKIAGDSTKPDWVQNKAFKEVKELRAALVNLTERNVVK